MNKEEIKFIEYVNDFYGIDGIYNRFFNNTLTKETIIRYYKLYKEYKKKKIIQPTGEIIDYDDIYYDFGSYDREYLRDIILMLEYNKPINELEYDISNFFIYLRKKKIIKLNKLKNN